MPKEQQENILENIPRRLSDKEISALVKKYPGVKLDEGSQHFVVEQKNERGKIVKSVFIPVWEAIPRAEGEPIKIEEELKRNLNLQESAND